MVAAASALPHAAQSQIYGGGAVVPAGGGAMPQYFAGTLNTASGSVYVVPPPHYFAYLVKAELFLGSPSLGFTKVKEWNHVPGEPGTFVQGLDVTFDSTRFPDQASLHVVVRGEDSLGGVYQDMKPVTVKNKALLGNHSFRVPPFGLQHPGTQTHQVVQDGLASATSAFGTGRYAVVKKLEGNLALTPWKQELGGANFVWATTHGTPDIYEMENGSPFTDAPEGDPNSHKAVLMATVGAVFGADSYPPYNPSGVPPCNFIFVDSCRTLDADFSWPLYPKFNLNAGPGGLQPKNQFVAGWKVSCPSTYSKNFAIRLIGHLAEGKPALLAFAETVNWYTANGIKIGGVVMDLTMLGFHGDPTTKVCGVYTGSMVTETGWYL